MRPRDLCINTILALVGTSLMLVSVFVAGAQTMQSTNYRIQSDSINVGGGLGTSTNYGIESTVGEVATGDSDSTSYGIRAGYQQMVNAFISITDTDTISLTPQLPGITGGESNGSTTVTVTTDSSAGYQLLISAESSPALTKGGDSIADYVPDTSEPDYTFAYAAGEAFFGYSPSGSDVVDRFRDDGVSLCNTGSFETALACWDGLSTTQETIAQRTSANTPLGSTTTIYFRVGIGGGSAQPPGIYTATTTLTAVPL